MNVFQTHSRIVKDYETYIRSFLNISDPKIRAVVDGELSEGKLWPEPLLQFNPSFEMAGNRQDAALQAGHFNDFVQVIRLRAGIHKALQQAPRASGPHWYSYASTDQHH